MGKLLEIDDKLYMPFGLIPSGKIPCVSLANHTVEEVLNTSWKDIAFTYFNMPYLYEYKFKGTFDDKAYEKWYLKNKLSGYTEEIAFFPYDMEKFAPIQGKDMITGKLYFASKDTAVIKVGSGFLMRMPMSTAMVMTGFTGKEFDDFIGDYLHQCTLHQVYDGYDVGFKHFSLMQEFYKYTSTNAKFF